MEGINTSPEETKQNSIQNKSLSATDNLSGPKRVVVRSLSVSEPLDIELRRSQRRHDHVEPMHKRPDSPGVISSASHEEKDLEVRGKRFRRKIRGRSRRRYYEPSTDRFPPPCIMKSNLKVAQEMPFWRLKGERFRRTVSSFDTPEVVDEKWRHQTLQNMPFSQFPWKKLQKLFIQPDNSKVERKRVKSEKRMKAAADKLARQRSKGCFPHVQNTYDANDPKITIRQRPQSISEGRSIVQTNDSEAKGEITKSEASENTTTLKMVSTSAEKPPLSPKGHSSEAVSNFKAPKIMKCPSSESSKPTKLRTGGSACRSCDRNAYRAESIEALGQVFHSSCFRCAGCMALLQRGNWYYKEGKFYCNPCHRKISLQTFRR